MALDKACHESTDEISAFVIASLSFRGIKWPNTMYNRIQQNTIPNPRNGNELLGGEINKTLKMIIFLILVNFLFDVVLLHDDRIKDKATHTGTLASKTHSPSKCDKVHVMAFADDDCSGFTVLLPTKTHKVFKNWNYINKLFWCYIWHDYLIQPLRNSALSWMLASLAMALAVSI